MSRAIGWHQHAKCAGDNLSKYVLDSGHGKVMGSIRDWTAQKLCAGCPVTSECMADAKAHGDTGVVRGGAWLDKRSRRNRQAGVAE